MLSSIRNTLLMKGSPQQQLIEKKSAQLRFPIEQTQGETHSVVFACAQEQGYRRQTDDSGLTVKAPLHNETEDVAFPLDTSTCSESTRVFVLADGHGGKGAPEWFVQKAYQKFTELANSKDWDLSKEDERTQMRIMIEEAFAEMDKEFCGMKIQQFQLHQSDPGSNEKPVDDGCTLAVNMLIKGSWFVNCNVGDTRTVLGALLGQNSRLIPNPHRRSFYEKYNSMQPFGLMEECEDDDDLIDSPMVPMTPEPHHQTKINAIFASNDHNMTHPNKIFHIYSNGGQFIQNTMSVPRFIQISSPGSRSYRPYSELIGARIYRPNSNALMSSGISNKRTLNLSSTMGDVLFKVAPATMSSTPDVRFVKLHQGVDYIMIAGTDGIWDHLSEQTTQDKQNHRVLSEVHKYIKRSETVTANLLQDISEKLVARESNNFDWETTDQDEELFVKGLTRYDDATAQVLFLKSAPPMPLDTSDRKLEITEEAEEESVVDMMQEDEN